MDLSPSIVAPVKQDPDQRQDSSSHILQQPPVEASYAPAPHTGTQISNEENSLSISTASHPASYKPSDNHMLAPPNSQMNSNCFNAKPQGHNYQTSNNLSPPRSQRSTPTPSPTSSPSPTFQSGSSKFIDLNSIVSYSQLVQRRDDVIRALKHRSGDHLASQALELLRAGRERVKRITAAGRAATGKPPVKHIQEQYLAVFSRFSDFCTSQNLPTWPIEPVRVAIWVLAMQEKAPPTPATLRQYITRLEFTCTVTAGLFENDFGPSSPLKASALLRELVNRDIPGQSTTVARPPRSPSTTKSVRKRGRSPSTFENHDGSQTPPAKKWQPFDNVAPEYADQYDRYMAPFNNSSAYQNTALVAHQNHHDIWPAHSHQHPERYSVENLHQNHPVPHHYHSQNAHPMEHHHPHTNESSRPHEVVGNVVQLQSGHRAIAQHQRYYPSAYENLHGHSNFAAHQAMVQPTSDGRYMAEPVHHPWV